MRTITRTYDLFPVGELSESARDVAHSEWLDKFHYYSGSDNEKTLEEFCRIFSVKCRSWEYDSCTYHYRFTTEHDEDIENLSGQRLATYLWNNYRRSIYKGKYYSKYPKYRYSRIFLDNCCPLTGYYIDHDILAPIFEHMDRPNPNTTFLSLIDHCLDSFFKACRDDYENSISKEGFVESAECNDLEFLATGKMFS